MVEPWEKKWTGVRDAGIGLVCVVMELGFGSIGVDVPMVEVGWWYSGTKEIGEKKKRWNSVGEYSTTASGIE